MKKLFFCAVLGSAIFASGCKKDEPTTPTTPVTPAAPELRVSFTNQVGATPLTLGAPYQYVNANNDSFYISTFKYYISNISFTDANNNTWSETESYHLINAADPASLSFTVTGIPAGDYVSMRFMIGVDSARNCSGAQTGALDPANDMFWTWNTGYIMAKLEGKSPVSTASAHNISFHIAGYSGSNATQRWITMPFGSTNAHVAAGASPLVKLSTNVLEWFTAPTTINFATTNSVATTGAQAVMFANNYSDMITLTEVVN